MIKHNNTFDFLRLFASFCVVIQHAVFHLDTNFLWVNTGDEFWFYDGVYLFFILSGLLVYKSCEKCIVNDRPVLDYYKNRVLRIVPGLYFYLIATSILILAFGVWDQIADKRFIAWFVSNVVLIPVYHPDIFYDFGTGVVNGSLWTIPVEFSFYIFLPLLILLRINKGSIYFWSSIITLSLAGYFLNYLLQEESMVAKLYNITFLPYLYLFFLGITMALIWDKLPKNIWLFISSILLYVLFNFSEIDIVKDLRAIPLSYAVVWFGYYGRPKRFLNKITKLGDVSYGVYIWHMIVINFVLYFNFNEVISGTLLIVIIFILSYMLSLLSWWAIEKPFLKLKPFSSTRKMEYVRKMT